MSVLLGITQTFRFSEKKKHGLIFLLWFIKTQMPRDSDNFYFHDQYIVWTNYPKFTSSLVRKATFSRLQRKFCAVKRFTWEEQVLTVLHRVIYW